MGHLANYLEGKPQPLSESAVAFAASLDVLHGASPEVAGAIIQELRDQRSHLKLIASENYCSLPVQLAMGNWLTDKYAEGVSGRRFYASCNNVDTVESWRVSCLAATMPMCSPTLEPMPTWLPSGRS
jgi:glycine hydroxymethyltransferase